MQMGKKKAERVSRTGPEFTGPCVPTVSVYVKDKLSSLKKKKEEAKIALRLLTFKYSEVSFGFRSSAS